MVWKGDARNRLAKSLTTLIDQVDQKFSSRDRHNDGTIGGLAHQQRDSDHNPQIRDGAMGVVTAGGNSAGSRSVAAAGAERCRHGRDRSRPPAAQNSMGYEGAIASGQSPS